MTSAIGGMDYRKRRWISPAERRMARKSVDWALEASRLNPLALEEEISSSVGPLTPASLDQTKWARDTILSWTTQLHGSYCLPRALATLFFCGQKFNTRPEVVIGARTDPFQAHAWVRAEGVAIDELEVEDYFRELKVY